jgi:cell division protein FtsW
VKPLDAPARTRRTTTATRTRPDGASTRAATRSATRPTGRVPATGGGDERRGQRLRGRPAGRRSTSFSILLALVVVLTAIGLVMVLSASYATAYYEYGSSWYQFERQLMWVALGLVAMVAIMRVDYHKLRRYTNLVLLTALGLMAAVMVPGLGVNVNGASRWLGYGSFRVQPSELAKLAVLMFVADLLARRADRVDDLRLSLKPVLVVFGLFAALLMLQPNLGTTILLGGIVFVMLFVAGVPLRPLLATFGIGAGLATFAAFAEPYRFRRLLAFIDPWKDPQNTGYQTIQSQLAISNGGVTGSGIGHSIAKFGFLPYAQTDFIFAIVADELGLVGAVLLIALFVAVGVVGVRIALHAPDRYGMLLATGITTWVLFQAFVNIGAVVGVLPITGVPLPFVSFGGSSLVVVLAAMGIELSIARQAS